MSELRDILKAAQLDAMPLPNRGKTFQWGWETEPPCLVAGTEHQYVERRPHNNRGYNYKLCPICGLTMYVDSSD